VTGGNDLGLYEINQAAAIIRETAHPDVNLIFGAVIDETMEDEVRITVIATGFEHSIPSIRTMTQRTGRPLPKGRPVRENANVSRTAEHSSASARSSTQRQTFRMDDLDIPTFLRKRQS
jgi:cell division protein FtsZ